MKPLTPSFNIGITGGIGSGKTTVCHIFESLGIPVFYADKEAKQLYDTEPGLKREIIRLFGQALYPNDLFDKTRMASIVFHDPAKLKMLNALVHPLVRKRSKEWHHQQGSPYTLHEAALLIESNAYKEMDEVILVSCPTEIRINRVIQRDHIPIEDVRHRMENQLSDSEKRTWCTAEIINDGSNFLIPQVIRFHETILNKIRSSSK